MMGPWLKKLWYQPTLRSVLGAAGIFVCCAVFQHSPELLEHAADTGVEFKSVNQSLYVWQAVIDELPIGVYYASIGRPRGACDLSLNGRIISSTMGEIGDIRRGLMLGAGFFRLAVKEHQELLLRCIKQDGFDADLTHKPVIMPFFSGQILQLWRGFNELILGPIAALGILASMLLRRGISASKRRPGEQALDTLESWRFPLFGCAALVYSLSLAYFSRLFMTAMAATIFHVFVRNIFSLAGLIAFTPASRRFRSIKMAQLALCGLVPVWAALSAPTFVSFYQAEYLFFPFSTLFISYQLYRATPKTHVEELLRRILLAWALVQAVDFLNICTGYGVYTAPSVVAFLCVGAILVRSVERSKTIVIESAVAKILEMVNSAQPIQVVLSELTQIARSHTRYALASAYVDSFCLGGAEMPGKLFTRVAEFGYHKDTSQDSLVDFREGRGGYMAETIRKGRPELRIGRDNTWFLVIPVSAHACINLSDDVPKLTYHAHEGLEIADRILPSLRSLDHRLIEQARSHGMALQKLRSLRGDGRWTEAIGSIFTDINDYSKYTDVYGDAFASFVSETYLPSLIRSVSQLASPEHTAGDEVYFVVIHDLVEDGRPAAEATVLALRAIAEFAHKAGADLCGEFGFEPLTLSTGVAFGSSTIVADPFRVRTSGKVVNDARRLQQEARRGEVLGRATDLLPLALGHFRAGEELLIQQKKNTILARRIERLATPAELRPAG